MQFTKKVRRIVIFGIAAYIIKKLEKKKTKR